MILVELYSKQDCHLCDVAKDVMMKIQQEHPFTLNVITIQEGDELYETFKERIPVIYINKEFAFQYKVPEKEFIKKLGVAEHSS
jgi:hypothetical protein